MERAGPLLAAQQYGVRADMISLGKGLGGGAPISALLAKQGLCCFAPAAAAQVVNQCPHDYCLRFMPALTVQSPSIESLMRLLGVISIA
jgi:acetylornithine/succinyldiaminopimelate/putrescine aminotransferase